MGISLGSTSPCVILDCPAIGKLNGDWGVFVQTHNSLLFMANISRPQFEANDTLMASPTFVRVDTLLNLTVDSNFRFAVHPTEFDLLVAIQFSANNSQFYSISCAMVLSCRSQRGPLVTGLKPASLVLSTPSRDSIRVYVGGSTGLCGVNLANRSVFDTPDQLLDQAVYTMAYRPAHTGGQWGELLAVGTLDRIYYRPNDGLPWRWEW